MHLLFTGLRGEVGSEFAKALPALGVPFSPLDLALEPPTADCRLVHMAARTYLRSAREQIESNISYFLEVLDYAERHRVPELVFFSTNVLYNGAPGPLICEESVLREPGIYALSKMLGERLLEQSTVERRLCLRLPGLLEIRRSTTFLAKAFDVMERNEPVKLSNANLPFNHFLPIPDLMDFITRAPLGTGFDRVNLAADPELSLLEIAERMRMRLGSGSAIEAVDGREKRIISNARAKERYGFSPTPSAAALDRWIETRRQAHHGER